MNIWIASHECSGISEAGGVKNVTFSLCKELQKAGCNITLFLPRFGCTSFSELQILNENVGNKTIEICGKEEKIKYILAQSLKYDFKVVFADHISFFEKESVYTYTEHEEQVNPAHKRGQGHEDTKFIDTLFSKSVSAFSSLVSKKDLPQIIHCQDASTALIPLFSSNEPLLNKASNVVTIHNAGPAYHHEYASIQETVFYTGFSEKTFSECLNGERVEPFLIASDCGALLTTVSPDYAEELCDPKNDIHTDGLAKLFFEKNIPVSGITNGIDVDLYEPSDLKKSGLPFIFSPEKEDLDGKYKNRDFFLKKIEENDREILKDIKKFGNLLDKEKDTVFLCYQGRLASQKGLKVFSEVIPDILKKYPETRIIVTGQGENELEKAFSGLAENPETKGKILFLNGYNKKAARLTVTSGDFIILPSFFEPCGLEDFIALIYGTLPVAHKTGGLNKILDGETGFLYSGNTKENLEKVISKVIELKKDNPSKINQMIKYGAINTRNRYLWEMVCLNSYIPLFENLCKKD